MNHASDQHDQPEGTPARSAESYAQQRDWPGYFRVTAGRPPRETLLQALELFDRDPPDHPLAVDLGCGEGRDTARLLRHGWRVHAIDGHPEALERLQARTDLTDPENRLTVQHAPFESVEIPACDLLNASFALPFCRPDAFDGLWGRIRKAIRPGGRFSGQLFGDRDTWAALPDRAHQSRERVEQLLAGLQIERLDEEERDGNDASGTPKHWHLFHIIARKV